MSAARYTRTAVALHWVIAVMIFGAFPLGVYMHELPLSPYKLQLYSYHKWLGIGVLLFAVLRLLWRATHKPPPPLPGMPRWQEAAAHAVHHSLYLLVLAVPLSGWLMSSALGFPVMWFGVLPLPDLIGKDKELGEVIKLVHKGLNITLLLFVLAHVAGAIKHHFIDRDATLARMLPFLDKEKS
ncbi:MAG: cytochrome b [Rhodocyclaceae bacterium]|nr:cytochrome b [Rhodocyclaceae bacterium]